MLLGKSLEINERNFTFMAGMVAFENVTPMEMTHFHLRDKDQLAAFRI